MKAKILFFIPLFLNCAIVKSQVNQNFIEKIQDYKEKVQTTSSCLMFDNCIDTATFNIKTYMEMFPSLKMRNKNYVFDYYYHYFDSYYYSDEKPHIYVKNRRFNLIHHINRKADKINLQGEEREDFVRRSIYWFLNDSSHRAVHYIYPEDTEEGYLQYLYFLNFGELFALKWHSNYERKKVITNKQEFAELLSGDTTQLQHVLLFDTMFSVLFSSDAVIVKHRFSCTILPLRLPNA